MEETDRESTGTTRTEAETEVAVEEATAAEVVVTEAIEAMAVGDSTAEVAPEYPKQLQVLRFNSTRTISRSLSNKLGSFTCTPLTVVTLWHLTSTG